MTITNNQAEISITTETVWVKWKSLHMSLDQWKHIFYNAIEAGENKKIWVADLYHSTGVFSQEILEYWSQKGIKEIKENGFKYVLNIVPHQKGLASMSDRAWKRPVEESMFQLEQFNTPEEVYDWIEMNIN